MDKSEEKKDSFFKDMTPAKKLFLTIAGVITLAVVGVAVWKHEEERDKPDDELARNNVFDIVSENCNSFGVNKMSIVDRVAKLIKKERMAKKRAESRVKYLEEYLLTYESRSKEDIETELEFIKSKTKKND